MPLTKVEFQPGIVKDNTDLASEGAWISADKVRFARGRAQTMGGWQAMMSDTFAGIARGGKSWTSRNGERVVAFGTSSKLYAIIGGALLDITPPQSEGVLTNPFATTNGSTTVTVTHAFHGLQSGSTVTFAHGDAVGGLTLNGTYTVTAIVGLSTYTITAAGAATSTVTAGGGSVDYTSPLAAGLVDALGGSGYGIGTYGSGFYGLPSQAEIYPRTWSVDNFGENGMFCPRNGGVYEWQPELSYAELIFGGDFAASTGWATGAGWSIAAGVATKTAGVASNLSQNVANVLEGGRTYRVTFDVTRTAGTVQFKINGGTPAAVVDLGDASVAINKAGSYSRLFRCPVAPSDIVFAADSTFAGTIDNVSVKLESVAYRIDEAPTQNAHMFVDPAGFVVLSGTQDVTGTFDPLMVRWSDQANNRTWVPDTSNAAGFYTLGKGGRAVAGLGTRSQNLIWTDDALYTMSFTGAAGSAFSFAPVGTGCGLVGPMAMAEMAGHPYWFTNTGQFRVFDGAETHIIDCGLRRDVADHIADKQQDKIACYVNTLFSEVLWLFPDSRDGNECSRYAAFNPEEKTWISGTMDRTTIIPAGIFENPIGFSTTGRIYYDEIGATADGAVLTGHLESSYFDIEDGHGLMNLKRFVPDFEDLTGSVSLTLLSRLWPTGVERTFGPYDITANTEKVDLRATGRQIKMRLDFSSSPASWRLGVARFDSEKSGSLR